MRSIEVLESAAVSLLQQMIATPSLSKDEHNTAQLIEDTLTEYGITPLRIGNNVVAKNKFFDDQKPNILLNSHHDTVKPNVGYTLDPFVPFIKEGKLFGLGSNDAGACLATLIFTFLHYYDQIDLPFNVVLVASAEEEISGKGGVEMVFQSELFQQFVASNGVEWHHWTGIVGEPTLLQMAVAEKGLMVIDAVAHGQAGHAARDEGINAINVALEDILWLSTNTLDKVSTFLGPVKHTATVIRTENEQHNVIPATCAFTIDVRFNECYSAEELFQILQNNLQSTLKARSMRLRSTSIDSETPLVKAGLEMGKATYGSPTLSDKALIPFPCLKMGPGDSARSHTANEFINLTEIAQGLVDYITILEKAKRYYE